MANRYKGLKLLPEVSLGQSLPFKPKIFVNQMCDSFPTGTPLDDLRLERIVVWGL